MSVIASAISYVRTFVGAVPGLSRLKGVGRFAGVTGMVVDIFAAGFSAVSNLAPFEFFKTVALKLVNVNQSLLTDINALKAGASTAMFWWHTWGIYSKLWFIVFLTGIIGSYLKNAHFGEQVPKYQLYLVIFVLILTPLQVLGHIIADVVNSGKFTSKELGNIGVWNGLYQVLANTDIWLKPSLDAVGAVPGVERPELNQNSSKAVKTLSG